ncbi:MAG: conjugal transfer protein TraF [Pseudomonadota bacterium]
MFNDRIGALSKALFASLCMSCTAAQAGTSFGIYDARTLAMGGTAAASAGNSNAQFYNAALLAFNEKIEEETRDSRFLLPILAPQLSKSAFDIERVSSDALAPDLTLAVDAYNAAPGSLTANDAALAATSLRRVISQLDGEDLFGDAYAGIAVSEPSKYRGAGFFLGTRLIAGGRSDVSAEDLNLLQAYEEGLRFIASGGSDGTPRPELFDPNGVLLDPVADLESTASAAGASIIEVGIAIADDFQYRGDRVAFGIGFKMLDIDTFEDVERIVDDRIDLDRNEASKVRFNVDLGLARNFGERWRLGVAIKDAIPYDVDTALDTSIRLRPRPRVAAAYATEKLQLALDLDVVKNAPLENEKPTQEAALGVEWSLVEMLRVRAGLRTDLRGNRALIASTGVGIVISRLAVDVAYAEGSDLRAAALQLGWVF